MVADCFLDELDKLSLQLENVQRPMTERAVVKTLNRESLDRYIVKVLQR